MNSYITEGRGSIDELLLIKEYVLLTDKYYNFLEKLESVSYLKLYILQDQLKELRQNCSDLKKADIFPKHSPYSYNVIAGDYFFSYIGRLEKLVNKSIYRLKYELSTQNTEQAIGLDLLREIENINIECFLWWIGIIGKLSLSSRTEIFAVGTAFPLAFTVLAKSWNLLSALKQKNKNAIIKNVFGIGLRLPLLYGATNLLWKYVKNMPTYS